MIAAGRLRDRIQFLQAVRTDDGLAVSETWQVLGGTRHAMVRRLSGDTDQGAGQVQATELLTFTVRRDRFTRAITAANRIRFGGVDHVITAVADDFASRDAITFTASVRADQ